MRRRLRLILRSLRADFTRRLLGSHTRAIVVESKYGRFAVDPEDQGVGRVLRSTGVYAGKEIERLRKLVTETDCVLVVGAHIGTLAIPIARMCREVIAIEANPDTFALLQTNLALNEISNCRAYNIAASDKDETLEFLKSRTNSGGSKRVPKTKDYIYYYDHPELIEIKAVRLDEFLSNSRPDIVIMDIEGSEYFALRGMQELLSQSRILVLEFLPHHIKNVGGVGIEEFTAQVPDHFARLTVPSQNSVVHGSEIRSYLAQMYQSGTEDEGIIFEKI